jgi:ATP-dependent helicase/DNAse subunit B
MPLALLAGPANAGKVARLLDGYLASLDREPVFVVPNRPEVELVERELLALSPGLLGGSVGTFEDLFRRILARRGNGEVRPTITDAQRSLLLARIASARRSSSENGLAASARFAGFADALGDAVAELESALLDPAELEGDIAALYLDYRAELDRLGLWDRQLRRGHAAQLVANDLTAWDGTPVFAYGFEDLTGAQWALLEALAGRADVTVSLPYEPGRAVFASLERTAGDLARLADGRIQELPPQRWYRADALAHLERTLFTERDESPPALEGAVRFLEGAGSRGALELVADEILALLRAGKPAEKIAVVAPSVERRRAALEPVFGSFGIPYAFEGTMPLGRTPLGHALLGLLRFSLGGTRRDLFAFLRSPYSGLPRHRADFLEGRLRGRAVSEPARVEEESQKLLGHSLPALDELRSAASPLEGTRALARSMLRHAYGLEAPPANDLARLDLRAHEAVGELISELEEWQGLGEAVGPEQLVGALERAPVRLARAGDPGRVAVLDLLRARTRRFEAVFVLGLEEGVFPRRAVETPFLPDDLRRELEQRGRRLARPDPLARERYLFYTACTRPWELLVLVRESADDEGRPREASPFYDEVRSRFDTAEVERWTRRRPLSDLTWDVGKAPTERERLRGVAALAASDADEARALARANGWERRIERALAAFVRPTRLTHPVVLRELAERDRFSVTELERFHDCSSMWLFERVVSPKEIDSTLDARIRGGVAHQALYRFYSGLPKRLGIEAVDAEHLADAIVFLRECVSEAIAGGVRLDVPDVELLELEETLIRDLEHFLRQEVELSLPLVPRRFEVGFGTSGAAVELQRGLELGGFTVSGKIDRIDLDPHSARGIVHDYKLGRAHSARDIEAELRLQVPLYILALRDLVGIEPLGGIYRGLTGTREARGLLRAEARSDAVPGFKAADYLDEDEFWARVDAARDHARTAVAGIRAGDVRHNPRGGDCPTWCKLWTMCRVRRL